jgi:hypothetical protein
LQAQRDASTLIARILWCGVLVHWSPCTSFSAWQMGVVSSFLDFEHDASLKWCFTTRDLVVKGIMAQSEPCTNAL